ncbi:MAG: hypothetical protein K2P84_03485 [Undibacterium sp.]|nr:hypothetical protein [Undibacterium sp.]
MQNLKIQLTLTQANLLLESLAERPFKQVFELIAALNEQASTQFFNQDKKEEYAEFAFSKAELRLMIEALGEMPFKRVQTLVQHLHAQISVQTAVHHN